MKKAVVLCLLIIPLYAQPIDSQKLHNYFLANYYQFGGDLQKTSQWYESLLQDQGQFHVFKGYLPFLYQTHQYHRIINLIPTLDTHFKDDLDIQKIIAFTLQKIGDESKANARFLAMADQFKDNQEIIFETVKIYIEKKEFDRALTFIDQLLNSSHRKPNNFIFYFLKSQIYLQQGKLPESLAAVRASLELFPQFDKSWLMYAILKEQAGKLSEAIKGYTNFLQMTVDPRQEIEKHLLQLVFKQKIAQQQNNKLSIDKECLEHVLILFAQQQHRQALKLIDQCITKNPEDIQAKLLKVQLLVDQEKINDAINLLCSWIMQEETKEPWLEAVHLVCRTYLNQNQTITLFTKLAKKLPDNARILLYVADSYIRAENPKKAVPFLEKAALSTQDIALKKIILFQIAVLQYQTKNYKKLETIFAQLQKEAADFAPYTNLSAYYYAHKGNNITKAQQLIGQALKKEQNNIHFLDTQAYIYYRQGSFKKALDILEPLASNSCKDFTILKHIAKIYYKQGSLTNALSMMERARTIAQTSQEKNTSTSFITRWSKQKA